MKLHGSGFELGDQVELMRADVPALRGRTARIRGAMVGDYRHEVVLPDEWTREPGEAQMRIVSSRRDVSGWAILRLTTLMLTPGSPLGVLPARDGVYKTGDGKSFVVRGGVAQGGTMQPDKPPVGPKPPKSLEGVVPPRGSPTR